MIDLYVTYKENKNDSVIRDIKIRMNKQLYKTSTKHYIHGYVLSEVAYALKLDRFKIKICNIMLEEPLFYL